MIDKKLLQKGIESIGLYVSKEQLNLMDQYAVFLIEKNKVMNLTRVTEPYSILTEHFLDSILALKPILPKCGQKILDIGTGAGFPGVPIAIMCPNCKVTMMDSTGKKINFVKETCEKLNIENVEFVIGRAEEEARSYLRESFDLVYARAVSNMKILSELSVPFVKIGGFFVALKSINYKDELNDAKDIILNLGGEVEHVCLENVPLSDTPRSLILIKKINKTQIKYPRSYGVIKK